MIILAVNCGSSSLKFQLIEIEEGSTPLGVHRRLARGLVDRIGSEAVLFFTSENVSRLHEVAHVPDHSEAIRRVLSWLSQAGFDDRHIHAIGHRVVHGGDRFAQPTLIEDEVVEAIDALSVLAPLHNSPALTAIRATREILGAALPMVATFDTAFHRTMPDRSALYAIPPDLAAKHSIRRYGFHGLAHRYMAERYAAITRRPFDTVRLVTLQLGNGCSATAIANGRSVDTSMGLTPLEGLVMGTRCGDADPSLAGFLARKEGVAVEEVESWLNTRSGLLGVSGRSRDMRELLEAEQSDDARAVLAIEMFCYRARKYIGAYLAAIGGADAVLFGGGIGENAPSVRERICSGMDWCGLKLDADRNAQAVGLEGRISADDSLIEVYVVTVDEEVVIAEDTVRCLSASGLPVPSER